MFKAVPKYTTYEFSPKKNRYCLCVFVYNEGERIRQQLLRTKPYSGLVDVIIADGHSTDKSLKLAYLRYMKVRSMVVIEKKVGLSAQMRMAFDYALKQKYQGVICMDGNNKDNPADVKSFIELLDNGYAHVQGSRFIKGGLHKNTPISRLLGIRLLHAPLISYAAGFHYTDTTNGFRAYSSILLQDKHINVFRDKFKKYDLHYHLAIAAPRLGYRTIETPVERIYPKGEVPSKIKSLAGYFEIISTVWNYVREVKIYDK